MSDKRIKICSINIRNFRSIRNETIIPKELNVFVGINDVGKSNILKALNLFFNGQTDYGKEFSYESDFSYLFPENSHGTREIKISITFIIPDTYSDFGEYVWTKTWRNNNFHLDVILNKKGNEPSPKSRIPSALRRIKYRYVPAVKSPLYFKTLLGDLYKAVTASLNNPLIESTQTFSRAIKNYTKDISSEVNVKLGMNSELTIPSNLNDIFQALIFETNNFKGGIHVPLTARGDGIQARHIPIILKYIADEDQKSRQQGSMKVCTIWGFEEPENGLEMLKAFEIADNFEEYSGEIQVFTTTHSPAFFMKRDKLSTEVFFVYKKDGDDETCVSSNFNDSEVAEKMGLMPIVAPFITVQSEKLRKAEEIYKRNVLTDIPTIMVEGETDEPILREAIKHYSSSLDAMLSRSALRIIYKYDGCGTTQLIDWVHAWLYSGFKSKLYVLFDKDQAGIKAKTEIESSTIYQSKQNTVNIRIQHIQPNDDIIKLFDRGINLIYEIEHLLSIEFWEKLKSVDLVSPRSDAEMNAQFVGLVDRDKSLNEVINNTVKNEALVETIVSYEPKPLKKKQIVSLLLKEEDTRKVTFGLKRTIEKMEQYFC